MEGVEEVLENHCLICNTDQIQSVDDVESNGESELIYKQLNVVFILQNILEVPTVDLQKYLMEWGNPSEWKVNLCATCNGAVTNAKRIYQEILESTKIYKAVKSEIIKIVKNSAERSSRRESSSGNICGVQINTPAEITGKSREFVRCHRYGPFSDPFVAGDLTALDAMKMGRFDQIVVKVEPNEEPFDAANGTSETQNNLFFCEGGPSVPRPIGEEAMFLDTNEIDVTETEIKIETYEMPEDDPDDTFFDLEEHREQKKSSTSSRMKTGKYVGESQRRGRRRKKNLKNPEKPIRNVPTTLQDFANDPTAPHGFLKSDSYELFCNCGKSYGRPHHLLRHIKEATREPGLIHYCKVCKSQSPPVNRHYGRVDDLRRHIQAVHEGVRKVCPICKKDFPIGNSLPKHVRLVHGRRRKIKIEKKVKENEPSD